jgi:cyclophilin family peptidyl-prolyl cis-trans isomerase
VWGGELTGIGTGSHGYRIRDEFHEDLSQDRTGIFSMAKAGPVTGGSSFFITYTYTDTPWLDCQHAVFGEVVEGMETVKACVSATPRAILSLATASK